MIKSFIFVFLGGGLGSVLRYICSIYLQRFDFFTFGTLFVNSMGGLLMGICVFIFLEKGVGIQMKLLFMTGFLGGFTTFSSFGMEVFLYVKNLQYIKALWHIALNNILVLCFVWLGYVVSKKIDGVFV